MKTVFLFPVFVFIWFDIFLRVDLLPFDLITQLFKILSIDTKMEKGIYLFIYYRAHIYLLDLLQWDTSVLVKKLLGNNLGFSLSVLSLFIFLFFFCLSFSPPLPHTPSLCVSVSVYLSFCLSLSLSLSLCLSK